MGRGRLFWTIRRFFFYGLIVLLISVFLLDISLMKIFDGAFANNTDFNLFYAYMLWSIPGYIIMVIISLKYAKSYQPRKSLLVHFLRFLWEDIVSPIYAFLNLIFGAIVQKRGREVDWDGLIWDVIWTILCGGFIYWGIMTQIGK